MKIHFKQPIIGNLNIDISKMEVSLNGKELKPDLDFEISEPEQLHTVLIFNEGILSQELQIEPEQTGISASY